MCAGEVYEVHSKAGLHPMVLAHTRPVTLRVTYRMDSIIAYRMTQAYAAHGTQGGGLSQVGGSMTGMLAVSLPRDADQVERWLETGDTEHTWSAMATRNDRPWPSLPDAVRSAYRLAHDGAAMIGRLSNAPDNEVHLREEDLYRHYGTEVSDQRRVTMSVVPANAFTGTWRDRQVSTYRMRREISTRVLTARTRLQQAGFWEPVSYTDEGRGTVFLPLSSFEKLIDMLPAARAKTTQDGKDRS